MLHGKIHKQKNKQKLFEITFFYLLKERKCIFFPAFFYQICFRALFLSEILFSWSFCSIACRAIKTLQKLHSKNFKNNRYTQEIISENLAPGLVFALISLRKIYGNSFQQKKLLKLTSFQVYSRKVKVINHVGMNTKTDVCSTLILKATAKFSIYKVVFKHLTENLFNTFVFRSFPVGFVSYSMLNFKYVLS